MVEKKRWINPLFTPMALEYRWPFIRLSCGRLMVVQDNAILTSADEGQS